MQNELRVGDKARKAVSFSMDNGGDDARQIHFTGAYKRYQKLSREERERPTNVSVRNLPEVEATVKRALPPPATQTPKRQSSKRSRNGSRSTESSGSSRSNSVSTQRGSEAPDVGENGMEVFDDTEQPTASTETPAGDYFATPERVQQRYQAVLNFVRSHAGELGLTDQLQPVRQLHGEKVPVKTSNIHDILDYHFSSPQERVQRYPPAGYSAFTQMARKNKFLAENLFTPQRGEISPMRLRKNNSKSDSSSSKIDKQTSKLSGKGVGKNAAHNIKGSTVAAIFKPMLW
jgi:hypothetical protein